MIRTDRSAGRTPFFVVASAGTTNTGAIDPIAEIADMAAREDLWLHVDAAYGGFFQLTERGRRAFAGVERADSITLDPHKGMFLPYGTGSLVVRDGARLREAHVVGAAYLQDFPPEDELPNFTEYSAELSRDFRGLRVWFPLALHGVDAFRAALDEKLDLARFLYVELSTIPELDLPWEPELTVVSFRLRDGSDDADRRLLDVINASKRVVLSSTIVEDRFTIRACILSHRTHRDRIEECAQIVRRAVADGCSCGRWRSTTSTRTRGCSPTPKWCGSSATARPRTRRTRPGGSPGRWIGTTTRGSTVGRSSSRRMAR
jgi:aromatic-L-amino-acid decarboxylase